MKKNVIDCPLLEFIQHTKIAFHVHFLVRCIKDCDGNDIDAKSAEVTDNDRCSFNETRDIVELWRGKVSWFATKGRDIIHVLMVTNKIYVLAFRRTFATQVPGFQLDGG